MASDIVRDGLEKIGIFLRIESQSLVADKGGQSNEERQCHTATTAHIRDRILIILSLKLACMTTSQRSRPRTQY
jgi:hypothetical protein